MYQYHMKSYMYIHTYVHVLLNSTYIHTYIHVLFNSTYIPHTCRYRSRDKAETADTLQTACSTVSWSYVVSGVGV